MTSDNSTTGPSVETQMLNGLLKMNDDLSRLVDVGEVAAGSLLARLESLEAGLLSLTGACAKTAEAVERLQSILLEVLVDEEEDEDDDGPDDGTPSPPGDDPSGNGTPISEPNPDVAQIGSLGLMIDSCGGISIGLATPRK